MKPIFTKTENSKRHANELRPVRSHFDFPKTDCDYHTTTFDLNGRCSGKRSFREISAGYFEHEARQSFVTEAAFFALIVITSAVPLISGAHAMLNFVRAIGGL
jgi:hypothetical protein